MGNSVQKTTMNNCVQKITTDTVEGIIISTEYHIDKIPFNPSEDPTGKYIWISMHTNNKNFISIQESGYIITMNNPIYVGQVWLYKIRDTK